jgi:hypothetical protein
MTAGESGRLPELGGLGALDRLPELGRVHWRPRADDRRLNRAGRLWTLCTVAHATPFVAGAVVLTALLPVTAPVGLILIAHAWLIPELYAARGASVLRTRPGASGAAEQVAVGLLGDLLDHKRRALHARTRFVLERGELGTWLLGEAGAVLVRPGGHRVNCYCVKVTDPDLPPSDRSAHLLLALRADEAGFATVANLVFSGAAWRLRRRLPAAARTGLGVAVAQARRA